MIVIKIVLMHLIHFWSLYQIEKNDKLNKCELNTNYGNLNCYLNYNDRNITNYKPNGFRDYFLTNNNRCKYFDDFITYELTLKKNSKSRSIDGYNYKEKECLLIAKCDYTTIIGTFGAITKNIFCNDIINLIFGQYLNQFVIVEMKSQKIIHKKGYNYYGRGMGSRSVAVPANISYKFKYIFWNDLVLDYCDEKVETKYHPNKFGIIISDVQNTENARLYHHRNQKAAEEFLEQLITISNDKFCIDSHALVALHRQFNPNY